MRVAITGATGFIGRRLCAELEAAGDTVLRIGRTPGESTALWDPVSGAIDTAALDGVDAVVHLAGEAIGEGRWTAARKRRIHDSRSDGTELIARTIAGLDRPPSVLLSGSAIGFYGDTGDRPVTESAPPGDGFLATVCLDWEAATAPAEEAGIRVAHLRTGIVLSPDGGALARQLPLFRWGLGGRSGPGRQWQSWISLDDEVGAIRWLLDHEISGAVNLTAPEPVTNADYASTLGRALRRPTTIIPMIGPRMLLGRELADSLLLTSQRVLPGVLEAAGFPFAHASLDAALTDLLG